MTALLSRCAWGGRGRDGAAAGAVGGGRSGADGFCWVCIALCCRAAGGLEAACIGRLLQMSGKMCCGKSRGYCGGHRRFSRVQWCGANDRGWLCGAVVCRLLGVGQGSAGGQRRCEIL